MFVAGFFLNSSDCLHRGKIEAPVHLVQPLRTQKSDPSTRGTSRRKRVEATSGFHNGRRPSTLLPVLDVREVGPAARAAEPAGRAWNLPLPLSGGQSCRSRRRFVTVALAAPASLGLPLPALARLASTPYTPCGRARCAKDVSARVRDVDSLTPRVCTTRTCGLPNKEVAAKQRAHKGDRSKIVFEDVSVDAYRRLFVDRHSLIVDLRKVPRTIG
jgi:hypothetical protein